KTSSRPISSVGGPGPRTQHSIEEKLRIVQETRVRGTSVATAARRHNVNPNQVSTTTKEPSIVPREIATIAFSSSELAEFEALSSCQGFDADDREAVVGHAAAVAPRGGTLTRDPPGLPTSVWPAIRVGRRQSRCRFTGMSGLSI